MKFPVHKIETWEDADSLIEWCALRKYEVMFRSTRHLAIMPMSLWAFTRAVNHHRKIGGTPEVMFEKRELVFEHDEDAIEYRLRFL